MATEFPLDWDEWRREYREWTVIFCLRPTRKSLPGKNMLADEILGTYNVGGQTVELSEVTFPNLSDRDPKTGRLLDTRHRYVGITWLGDKGECVNGGLAESFAELESLLKNGQPGKDV